MHAVTIRNIPDEVHRALKRQAKLHGKSTAAEIRSILETAVTAKKQVGLGTALRELGAQVGGVELDITRDPTPARAASFE